MRATNDSQPKEEIETQKSSFRLSDSRKESAPNLNHNNSSYLPEPEMLSSSPNKNGRIHRIEEDRVEDENAEIRFTD